MVTDCFYEITEKSHTDKQIDEEAISTQKRYFFSTENIEKSGADPVLEGKKLLKGRYQN